MPKDRVLGYMTDAANVMKSSAKLLQNDPFYETLYSATRVALGLHNVTDAARKYFKKADEVIMGVEAVFVKAPKRRKQLKQVCPRLKAPPSPIVTRWGTWLDANSYFEDNKNRTELIKRLRHIRDLEIPPEQQLKFVLGVFFSSSLLCIFAVTYTSKSLRTTSAINCTMGEARVCGDKCVVPNGNSKVKCFVCKLLFHMECYKLDSIKNVGGVSNLQFVCDGCMINSNSNDNIKDNITMVGSDEIAEIKSIVLEIQSQLKVKEKPLFSSVLAANRRTPYGTPNVTPSKRQRTYNDAPADSADRVNPSALKQQLFYGTKDGSLGLPVAKKQQPNLNRMPAQLSKSIFLTNLSPDTSVELIMNYINKNNIRTEKFILQRSQIIQRIAY